MDAIDIDKVISVMDDMDRLIKVVDSKYDPDDDMDPVDSGFMIIRDNLERALNSAGAYRIRCFVGDRFDVRIHEAVGTHDLDDFERYEAELLDDMVYEVVRSGWKIGNRIRPCQVVVSR